MFFPPPAPAFCASGPVGEGEGTGGAQARCRGVGCRVPGAGCRLQGCRGAHPWAPLTRKAVSLCHACLHLTKAQADRGLNHFFEVVPVAYLHPQQGRINTKQKSCPTRSCNTTLDVTEGTPSPHYMGYSHLAKERLQCTLLIHHTPQLLHSSSS